jgi:hypothetical protein
MTGAIMCDWSRDVTPRVAKFLSTFMRVLIKNHILSNLKPNLDEFKLNLWINSRTFNCEPPNHLEQICLATRCN